MLQTKVFMFLIIALASKKILAFQPNDEKCDEQLSIFSEGIAEKEFWAIKLVDLWGKIDSGFLFGSIRSFGRFHECLNFMTHTKDEEKVQGQYCLVSWNPPQAYLDQLGGIAQSINFTLSNGLCLPASCSQEKVLEFVNSHLQTVDLKAVEANCQTSDSLPFDGVDIAAILMLAIVGVSLIVSTSYDLISQQQKETEKKPQDLFVVFSVYTNCQRLFKIDRNKPSKIIDCLEGLRCVSLICIIFTHRYMVQAKAPTTNFMENIERVKFYYSVAFIWQIYCVDTFLVIGGLLSALKFLFIFQKKKFNALTMIAHRYLRYTPVLAASTLIYTSLSRHIKSPYPDVEGSENCHRYWWSALLHIQNYVNPLKVCPSHAWYLSVDFQLYIISPLLIFPAFKYGCKYLWSLLAFAILSSISVIIVCCRNNFRPLYDGEQSWISVDVPTHARIAPWLIGMALGYVIFESQGRKIIMNKALVLLLWLLSLTALIANLCLQYHLNQLEDNKITVLQNAMIKGLSRLFWSFSIAWIIFACYKLKSGGLIRWFLSMPEWQPLRRISLSIYLTHQFYQRLTLMNEKASTTLEVWPAYSKFLGDFLAALFIGTFFYLCFEIPFVIIERIVFHNPQKKTYEIADNNEMTVNNKHGIAD